MFRISRGESGFDAETIERASERLAGMPAGRYDVDEIRAEPFPSGHTSRQWGRLLRHPGGEVEAEPHPWPQGETC
jgi:hypothetical protein